MSKNNWIKVGPSLMHKGEFIKMAKMVREIVFRGEFETPPHGENETPPHGENNWSPRLHEKLCEGLVLRGLVIVWGTAREAGCRSGEDWFCETWDADHIDEMAGFPLSGMMEKVNWLHFNGGAVFPNIVEFMGVRNYAKSGDDKKPPRRDRKRHPQRDANGPPHRDAKNPPPR